MSNWQNWYFANLSVSLMKDDLMQSRGYLTTKIVHKASQFSIQTQQTVSHIKIKRSDTNYDKIEASEDCKSEQD